MLVGGALLLALLLRRVRREPSLPVSDEERERLRTLLAEGETRS